MEAYKGLQIATIILFVTECIVGMLVPMFWQVLTIRNVKGIESVGLQLANCFAGGILLACGQISVLGPATQYLIEKGIYYPLTYLIALAIFALIFSVDKLFGGELEAENENESETIQQGQSQIQWTQEQLEDIQIQRTKTGDIQKQTQKKDIDAMESEQKIDIKEIPPKKKKFPITGIILMFALFLDSHLEGIALGLQDSMDGVIQLMIGFLTHQWSETLLLVLFNIQGLNLKKKGIGKLGQLFIQLPIISACPIGAAIGFSVAGTDPLIEGILLSMAAGAFLYVSTLEMLFEEISNKRHVPKKLIAFWCGVTLILALGVIGNTEKREEE